MMQISKITLIIIIATFFSGCSNVKTLVAKTSSSMSTTTSQNSTGNPLKSKDDILIEALITGGTWIYQRQGDDCNDTRWKQRFNQHRYYQSSGSACNVPDSFSVEAESWHIKDQYLYIANFSPEEKKDIVLRYKVEYLNKLKMVLSSNGYQYVFTKATK